MWHLEEISMERCAPLSTGGAPLRRGAYLLRGGDLSHLSSLICGELLELGERWQPHTFHLSHTISPSCAPSLLGKCTPLAIYASSLLIYLMRGAYLLRGGNLSHLSSLIRGELLELGERWQPHTFHLSHTFSPSGAPSFIGKCTPLAIYASSLLLI
jgi:hypothetical protein